MLEPRRGAADQCKSQGSAARGRATRLRLCPIATAGPIAEARAPPTRRRGGGPSTCYSAESVGGDIVEWWDGIGGIRIG